MFISHCLLPLLFPPPLFHWAIFANANYFPKSNSFSEKLSMPHGSLVTLMGVLECTQTEKNPELEPPIP